MHVARQAINDANGHLYGYELLFRGTAGATRADLDTDGATTQTILAAFAEFGAAELLGGKPGFINLTRKFLVGDLPLPFSPDAAVLEIVETIDLDPEVVLGALRLAAEATAWPWTTSPGPPSRSRCSRWPTSSRSTCWP